jgi:hypothetical protein
MSKDTLVVVAKFTLTEICMKFSSEAVLAFSKSGTMHNYIKKEISIHFPCLALMIAKRTYLYFHTSVFGHTTIKQPIYTHM